MKKRYSLGDEFDNSSAVNGYNHFTHYDYLLQLIDNGQLGAFKDHIKEITNKGLLIFLPRTHEDKWYRCVSNEIESRMIKE